MHTDTPSGTVLFVCTYIDNIKVGIGVHDLSQIRIRAMTIEWNCYAYLGFLQHEKRWSGLYM